MNRPAPPPAIDLTDANMAPWPGASIEGVRDAILDGRVSAMALDPDQQTETSEILEYMAIAAAEAVRSGRMIDCGHLPNAVIKSEARRAKDLVIDGWIDHPFRSPYVIFHTWEEGPAPLLVMPDPEGGRGVQVAEMIPCQLRGFKALLLGDVGELLPQRRPGAEDGFVVRARVSPLKMMHAKPGADMEAMMRDAACNLGDPLWTVLAMLATDGVEVERIPAPERLNRQRAAKGRWPIPERQRVRSAEYVTALLNRMKGAPKGGAGAGHHASPVMHVRRGHPRLLPTGRRVWVRDSIVGAKDDVAVRRSHYRINPSPENKT